MSGLSVYMFVCVMCVVCVLCGVVCGCVSVCVCMWGWYNQNWTGGRWAWQGDFVWPDSQAWRCTDQAQHSTNWAQHCTDQAQCSTNQAWHYTNNWAQCSTNQAWHCTDAQHSTNRARHSTNQAQHSTAMGWLVGLLVGVSEASVEVVGVHQWGGWWSVSKASVKC